MVLANTTVAKSVRSFAQSFRPEAILSVAHGYLFFAGFKVAKSFGLPFHLIIHDDWPTTMIQEGLFARYLQRKFRKIYRGASTRLCLSKYMLEEYQHRYGRSGDHLPPLQEEALPDQEALACAVSGFREFVVAYTGSLWTADYIRLLEILASVLRSQTWGPEKAPGYLDIYTNHEAAALSLAERYSPSVRAMPFLPPADLIKRLRRTATLTFVPMSFQPSEQATVRVAFPSKLADLTAAGMPILVCGPPYASAVRWAEESHCGLVVESDRAEDLAQALHRIAWDAPLRSQLAARVMDVGGQQFSGEMIRQQFYHFLQNSRPASDMGQGEPRLH
jgi:glycosyltransferase involved in cell wall biosynthesis